MSQETKPRSPWYDRALKAEAEVFKLQAAARNVINAFWWAEGNRGRFSCVDLHDSRCPKSRADSPDKWRGEWTCECGSEELDAAIDALAKAVGEDTLDGR